MYYILNVLYYNIAWYTIALRLASACDHLCPRANGFVQIKHCYAFFMEFNFFNLSTCSARIRPFSSNVHQRYQLSVYDNCLNNTSLTNNQVVFSITTSVVVIP